MGFLSNIFVAPGSSAAHKQDKRNSQVASGSADLFNALQPLLLGDINFAKSIDPQRQAFLMNGIRALTQGFGVNNNQNYITQAGNQAYGTGLQNAKDFLAAHPNTSPNLQAALQLKAMNDRANAAGNAYNQVNNPQAQLAQKTQMLSNVLGLYGQAYNPSGMNMLSSAGGLVYGQPKVQVQPGFGQVLGNLAGMYIGAGMPGMGGGGGAASAGATGSTDVPYAVGNPANSTITGPIIGWSGG